MSDKITALYVRVSTDMQKEKGESIDFQKSRLKEYAKEHGHQYKVYEDAGYSAKDTDRPALRRLTGDIEKGGIELVLVVKVDRITRQMRDLYGLLTLFEKYGVGFKALTQPIDTTTSMGRMILNMLGSLSQMEREMISDRVVEHMLQRAKNGKYNGGVVPYGYTTYALEVAKNLQAGLSKDQAEERAKAVIDDKKKLQIEPSEADMLKRIYQKYLELESLRSVTHWLNESGLKTRRGLTWATTSIRRVLTNPVYRGKVWYNKRSTSKMTGKLKINGSDKWIIEKGEHQAIIDQETYDKVQAVLKRQSVKPKRKMSQYLLSGLTRCGKCGGSLNGYTLPKSNKSGNKIYTYYRCHTHTSKGSTVCEGNTVQRHLLEQGVVETILFLTERKGFKVDMKKALDEYNRQVRSDIKPLTVERNSLVAKLDNIEKKKQNLIMLVADSTITRENYRTATKALEADISPTSQRLGEIESKLNTSNIEGITFEGVYSILKDFRATWQQLDFLGKKDLLWALIKRIVVTADEIQVEMFFLPSLFSNFRDASLPVREQRLTDYNCFTYDLHIEIK